MKGCAAPLSRRTLLSLLAPGALPAQAPYKDRRTAAAPYEGPGRDAPSPEGLQEVDIGFFGPEDAAHPAGGAVYMGVQFAIEEANAQGGYRGFPFRLRARWSDDPWRAGASAVVQLAYKDKVWAILGGVDGAGTHLAAQVVAKALLPLVDPVSTDETVNYANVPWVFSWAPGDAEIARFLAAQLPGNRFTLVAGTDHDSRILAAAFLKTAAQQGRNPLLRIDVSHSSAPSLASAPEPWVAICPPAPMAAVVAQAPPETRVLCGPAASSRRFRELAGAAANRVCSPALVPPSGPLLADMSSRFQQPADAYSVLAYQASAQLLAAIREAGLNRALIRDRLAPVFGPTGRRSAPATAPAAPSAAPTAVRNHNSHQQRAII